MKIVLIILMAFLSNDPKEIAKINALKKEAEKAYLAGDFELALAKYAVLSDSMGINEDEIILNLAHSHYQLGDTTGAKNNYNQLARSKNSKLKSIAYQQLGVMSKDANKLEGALQQLKSAIKSDPTNQGARYDYEVVKKMLKEQQEEEQKQDQENEDGEEEEEEENEEKNDEEKEGDKENEEKKEGESEEKSEEEKSEEEKDGEQKEGEEEEPKEKSKEEMTKEKLAEMNISEEKARMLLEAMRQNEIKYLQQQKRKATERPPSGKPDW